MAKPELFENIRRQLLRRGVTADYAGRLVAELEEHHRETVLAGVECGLNETQAETEALKTMGTTDEIVNTTMRTLRRSSWIGRHPILCMAAAPALLYFPLAFIASLPWIFIGEESVNHANASRTGLLAETWKLMFELTCNVVLPLICMFWIGRLGRSHFCGRRWTVVGLVVTFLLGVLVQLHVDLQSRSTGKTVVSLGLNTRWPPSANFYQWTLLLIAAVWLFNRWRISWTRNGASLLTQ